MIDKDFYKNIGPFSLDEIASKVDASVFGNGDKKILDIAYNRIDQDFIEYASKNFVEQIIDGEGREGILAFIEKRKPEWKK